MLYRMDYLVPFQIDTISIKVKQLSVQDKNEIITKLTKGAELQASIFDIVRRCLKELHGVEDQNGEKYVLSFDASGFLTEECLNEVMNIEFQEKIVAVCSSLLTGVQDKIIHPHTKEVIEGISIIKPKVDRKKK